MNWLCDASMMGSRSRVGDGVIMDFYRSLWRCRDGELYHV